MDRERYAEIRRKAKAKIAQRKANERQTPPINEFELIPFDSADLLIEALKKDL